MSNIDYDKHYPKHCVRYYGWLPASKALKELIDKKSIKYFTLCAKQAIDIFMLELEGVIIRDQNRKLPNVIICEKDGRDAAEIFNLVRPPLKEAILVGELERILTFQDTEETIGRSTDEDVKDRKIREQLRIKVLFERAKKYFPFDIINFDPHGNLFNPSIEKNKLYHSFNKIFELQEEIDTFLLFVTTPIYDIHQDTESRLQSEFESNVSSHAVICAALQSSLGTIAYNEIEEKKRIAIGFTKSVVISAAKTKGWNHKHHGIFIYESLSGRKMISSVVQFSKAHATPDESIYVEDIVRVIKQMPKYYSYEDSLENQEVKEHLEKIKEYREKIRNEFKKTS
jgi:hypothetical protein